MLQWVWLGAMALTVVLAVRELPALQAPYDALAASRHYSILKPLVAIHLPEVASTALRGGRTAPLIQLDVLLRSIWISLSVLMMIGLTTSAFHVYLRRRQWPMRIIDSQCVGMSRNVGPAVVGLVRPTIVLPEWVLRRTGGERHLIIAHEISHLLARDPLSITLALLALLVLPWNPLLWWQLHRLRHAIEVDCDARVLSEGHDLTAYGEALIEVGQRKSRYLGTVAAMSESRTLLEKRIEIMSQKNRRPWSIGAVVLSGAVSLSIAVAASQVTAGDTHEGIELKLDAATLDRYVGHYRFGNTSLLTITRRGNELSASITGQPTFPIYPDDLAQFHWKVVAASVTFSGDANGLASSATIHQNGTDIVASRVDASVAAQTKQQLADRMAANVPQPGTEAALRKTIGALENGAPNYGDMSEPLQSAVRRQKPATDGLFSKLGAIRMVEFRGVSDEGADKYLVTHQTGKQSQWLIELGSDKRIVQLVVLSVF